MPNRILRDWTQSDKIDSISTECERFFIRLIMKADDYGCFYADVRLLKANLFPLKLDKIREADLLRWMTECQKAGLIVLYEVDQKKYLQIVDFKQRLDKAKAKFPLPPSIIENQPVSDFREVVIDSVPESEVETEVETRRNIPPDLSKSNLFRQPNIPTLQAVIEKFVMSGGTKEMAQKFFDTNEAVGWFYRGSPITNFGNFVQGYIRSWQGNTGASTEGMTSQEIYKNKLLKSLA